MRVLSWNVQYGKATDGSFDFVRTLDYIKSLGEFDVICLQEISRHMADYCLPGQEDHLQIAQQHFEGYSHVWGSGYSWPSAGFEPLERQEFGNLTLIKPELLDYRVHHLPQPAVQGKWQMPRVAIETCINSSIGYLSIINTHLAFHDANENQRQIEHISYLEKERLAQHKSPKDPGPGSYQSGYLASARIICGDFNFEPESSHYQYQISSGWRDAQKQCNPETLHQPTCGIYDTAQWPQGVHCRDYFWLSQELGNHKVHVTVDSTTDLSDHQPIILEINI